MLGVREAGWTVDQPRKGISTSNRRRRRDNGKANR